ncbi:MAG: hypothetical protein DRP56_09350 [Planctomycetota bacterium]|nr:MAG: hypothetical protein DRP56_09350 [Planctomycetota bacterium]
MIKTKIVEMRFDENTKQGRLIMAWLSKHQRGHRNKALCDLVAGAQNGSDIEKIRVVIREELANCHIVQGNGRQGKEDELLGSNLDGNGF